MTIGDTFFIFYGMNIRAIARSIDMDYDEVLEDFCGDVQAITSKLESYLDDCAFESLEEAVEKEDATLVKKGAHRVRKCSEKLGLKAMEKYAGTLENAKSDRIASAFEPLAKEYAKVKEVLEKKDEEEEDL